MPEVPVVAAASPRTVARPASRQLLWVVPRTVDDHQARVEPHAEGKDVSCKVRAEDRRVVHALTQLSAVSTARPA